MIRGPVAVTGAQGRLGRALLTVLKDGGAEHTPWSRPDYDLDDPAAAGRLVAHDQPSLVIHAAAWTDVDGCAREPERARRRNGDAVAELAAACTAHGSDLLIVSTNEVFAGNRTDGAGYLETDPTDPPNAYGQSKLDGERRAAQAIEAGSSGSRLWIVRTAWLFGPPGADFPAKILAARDRLPAEEPLSVVTDEIGSPTYTPDLAAGLLRLVERAPAATYHLTNGGHASRFEWAERVLRGCGRVADMRPISRREFDRPSAPPAWGVLDGSAAAAHGVRLRPWEEAFDAYLPELCARG